MNNVRLDKRLDTLIFRSEIWLSRAADLIIHNSWAGRKFYVNCGLADERATVIPNGIDTERFRPNAEARPQIRSEWGIGDEVLIGLVARFDPMKDHATFLQAAALFAERRPDVRFVCVGWGPTPYLEALQAQAAGLGLGNCVIWAGARLDVDAIHNAFDISTSSSAYGEGFSNTVGEAMASGVPCVVTDVGDSALIVGDTGIVVPHSNPAALAEGWERMLERISQQKSKLSSEVRERITGLFSVPNLVQRTRHELEMLVPTASAHKAERVQ
jgi:glycosyltransferase involved in cell wall biosynthesis